MTSTTETSHHLVRHREGTCVSAAGAFAPDADHVPTLCDHVVNLPFGYQRGVPDCPECRTQLARVDRGATPT
ncbi:hypothetical protein [Miltoncostaea oceani]|uniref:hypothetical protein n=1 Tax=Miltoncostaea oceani TaxID=2843216 RepID=UPI001C3D3D88|nr:hypothetical protein [Miltoncostaea oceani]